MANSVLPSAGLDRAAQLVLDDISHAAVGTGTTTPATGDTKLVTETNRATPSKTVRQGAKIHHRTLFANNNLPATTEELGWFMNGTASADSGSIIARALSTFAKGDKDLVIILEITLKEG